MHKEDGCGDTDVREQFHFDNEIALQMYDGGETVLEEHG